MSDVTIDPHDFGISKYRSLLGCIKRYYCEMGESGADADYGTALHAWLAWYHWGDRSKPFEGELNTSIPERSCSEAELARRYAKRFSPNGLGKALIVEARLHMTVKGEGWEEPFAGTLDAVVEVDEACAAVIATERGIIVQPGRYLIDHKTKKQKAATLVTQYLTDPQFTGYCHLAAQHGLGPVQGTLCNLLFRYKEDKPEGFMLLAVDQPDASMTDIWRSIVRDARQRERQHGVEWKDPTRCFDYGRLCGCYESCSRHNL